MSIESAGALVPDPLIADPTITESASALDPDPLIIEPIIIESAVPDVIRFYFFFITYILLFYFFLLLIFYYFIFFYYLYFIIFFFFLLLISYYISFFIIILLLFWFLTINFIISYKINFKKSKLFCIYNAMYRQLNYHSNVSSLFYKYTYNQRPKV